jgi:hypothetical protein
MKNLYKKYKAWKTMRAYVNALKKVEPNQYGKWIKTYGYSPSDSSINALLRSVDLEKVSKNV